MMKKFLLSIAAFFVAIVAVAQTQLPNDPSVRIGKLDNGMTYYIRHNAKPAQRAEYYLATNVGAFQETDDQDGLAHFLEHMCFNGTKNFPGKSLLNYLQNIGAEFGPNINASTGFERTQYMLNNMPTVREGIIDSCLLVMHDYSHFVTCDPKEIDNERGVILEERRARRNANWRLFEKSLPYYFTGTPYVKHTLIGAEDQLKNFKPQSLVNFYKTWYQPDMQAIVVVGDIDVDQIEAKIKKIFSDIPKPATPTNKINHKVSDNKEPMIGILTDPEAMSSNIEVIWKSEPMPLEMNSTVEGFATDMMKDIIQIIMAERLDDITSKPGAPFLNAGFGFDLLCNSCETTMGTVSFKDGNAKEAFRAFMLEVEKMKRFGFTEAEIERAKTNLISSYEKRAEAAATRENDDFVDPIMDNFFFNKTIFDPAQRLEIVKALCAQMINSTVLNQVAPQIITDENMVILYKGPEKAGLVNPTEKEFTDILAEVKAADIKANVEEVSNEPLLDPTALKGAKSKGVKAGKYGATEWIMSNGVKVVVLPTQHKKDQVSLNLVEDGGKSLIATADLASFDDNLWYLYQYNKGLSKFTNSQLKKMLTGKNVSTQISIDDLEHSISATSTPKDLETAFQLLYLEYTAQRFSADEYKLGVDQLAAVLPNLVKTPDFAFQKMMEEKLYPNNPRKEVISENTLKNANITTVERVYKQLFDGVNGATFYVVGNVNVDSVKPLIEKYIGSIPKGVKPSKFIDRKIDPVKGNVNVHEYVEMTTPKSFVFQKYTAAMPYTVKDRYMLKVCQYVLDMVYVETLRESEGGTYSPSVWTDFRIEPTGLASINLMVQTNEEMEARLSKMAKDELAKLAKNGLTDEQMNRAIENFKKNLPEDRVNNDYWEVVLSRWYENGIDYDAEMEKCINSVTKAEVNKFLADFLKQNNAFELILSPKK